MRKSTCIVAEQRSEDRKPAEGEIWFDLREPRPLEIRGRLLDSSSRGFRASHAEMALSAGQRVFFCHAHGEGSAVVIWNRIMARHVETGFLIVDK
jgi:hypothetical protein